MSEPRTRTKYEYDSETGPDHAFTLYYSSRLGRFLSTDPLAGGIGDLQSHNAYPYTSNNPVNMIDPSGLSDCPDLKIGCMPSYECEVGLCLVGAAGVDLFGGGWADFWGGDTATANRMFLLGAGIVDNFDILQIAYNPCLAELRGDCSQPANLDWLSLLNLGGPGGRTQQQIIEDVRKSLLNALVDDPSCIAALDRKGGDALNTLKKVPITVGYLPPDNGRPVGAEAGGSIFSGPSIIINSVGPFFRSGLDVQGLILLHELGHLTNALRYDRASTANQEANQLFLDLNCKDTLYNLQPMGRQPL